MDSCLVCLEDYREDSYGYPGIRENSVPWNKYKIKKIIKKHLWWWYCKPSKPKEHQRTWICQECWEKLWSFHRFYLQVQKKHNEYEKDSKILWTGQNTKSNANNEMHEINLQQKEEEAKITIKQDVNSLNESSNSNESQNLKIEKTEIEEFMDNMPSENEADDFDSLLEEDMENTIGSDYQEPSEEPSDEEFIPMARSSLKRTRKKTAKSVARPGKKTKISSVELVRKYDDYIEANFKLKCGICQATVPDFYRLKTHFMQDHQNERPFIMCCNLKFCHRSLLVDHIHIHKNPDCFKCKVCESLLPNRRALKNHLEKHDITNKPKNQCPVCDKVFYSKYNFEKHQNLHLPESEKHFACTDCHKKFATDALRVRHFNTAHLKIYGKICDLCGKHFTNQDYYRRHMAVHEGRPEPTIPCDICGKKIATMAGLNRHKKRLHSEEATKEVECPHCSRILNNAGALVQHIDYFHKEWKYSCKYCNKSFRTPKPLREHIRRHEEGRTLTCPYCPKACRVQKRLDIHIRRSHVEEWQKNHANKEQLLENGNESEFDSNEDEMEDMDAQIDESDLHENLEENCSDEEFLSIDQSTSNLEKKSQRYKRTYFKTYPCPYCPRKYQAESRMDIHVRRVHTKEWDKARAKKEEEEEEIIQAEFEKLADDMDMDEDLIEYVESEDDEITEMTVSIERNQ